MNFSLTYLLNNKESCNPFASTSRSSSSSCSTNAIPSSCPSSTPFSANIVTHQRSVSMPQIKTPYSATTATLSNPFKNSKTTNADIYATSRLSDLASVIESSLRKQDTSSDNDDNEADDVEKRKEETGAIATRMGGLAVRRGSSDVKLPSISNLLNPVGANRQAAHASATGQCTTQRGFEEGVVPSPPDSNEQSPQFAPRSLPPPSLPRSRFLSGMGAVSLSLPQITANPSGHVRSRSFDSVVMQHRNGGGSALESLGSASGGGAGLVYRHSKSFDHAGYPSSRGMYAHQSSHPYAAAAAVASREQQQYPGSSRYYRSNSTVSTNNPASPASSYHSSAHSTQKHPQASQKPINAAHKSLRYDMLKDGTPVQRSCGDCSSNHTSGHWCQDPLVVGGYICQKCYRRRKRAKGPGGKVYTPPARTCHTCAANTTTSVWFRHFSIREAYVCCECHEKEASADPTQPQVRSAAGALAAAFASSATTTAGSLGSGVVKKCHGCGSCKSTQWTVDSNGYVCRKCARQLGLVFLHPSTTATPSSLCLVRSPSALNAASARDDDHDGGQEGYSTGESGSGDSGSSVGQSSPMNSNQVVGDHDVEM